MFVYCTSLASLDISNYRTSEVTDMNSMFSNCSSLTTLDLSKFDISKVDKMHNMFQGCAMLEYIIINYNKSLDKTIIFLKNTKNIFIQFFKLK